MLNPLESPTPIIVCGVVAEIILAITLWRTGRGWLLWLMVGVLGVALAGLAIEHLVVTPRKQITALIENARDAVLAHDLQQTLAFLAPTAKEERLLVQEVMRRVEIREAAIRDLEIEVEPGVPQRAVARLLGLVSFRDRQGEFSPENYPVRLQIRLQRFNQRWLITEILDAGPGFTSNSEVGMRKLEGR